MTAWTLTTLPMALDLPIGKEANMLPHINTNFFNSWYLVVVWFVPIQMLTLQLTHILELKPDV